jgi:hypothetical protein
LRPVYGPVLSVVRAAAYEHRLLTIGEVRAQLDAADRGAALVTAPQRVRITDTEAQSRARVERHFGGG